MTIPTVTQPCECGKHGEVQCVCGVFLCRNCAVYDEGKRPLCLYCWSGDPIAPQDAAEEERDD